MVIYSLNTNGLKSAIRKGLKDSIEEINPDVICLQEIKCQKPIINFDGYYNFWSFCKKKGFSGTAIFTKYKPFKVSYDFDNEFDTEGRIITVEYETFFIVNVYVPCSRRNLKRTDYRMEWNELFYEYIKQLENRKPVILCGDFNIDVDKEFDDNELMEFDREEFYELLEIGFIDAFRYFYPEEKEKYSWWFVGGEAKEKNDGCRIDYFLVSEYLKNQVKNSKILEKVTCSDHCPITLEINLDE